MEEGYEHHPQVYTHTDTRMHTVHTLGRRWTYITLRLQRMRLIETLLYVGGLGGMA